MREKKRLKYIRTSMLLVLVTSTNLSLLHFIISTFFFLQHNLELIFGRFSNIKRSISRFYWPILNTSFTSLWILLVQYQENSADFSNTSAQKEKIDTMTGNEKIILNFIINGRSIFALVLNNAVLSVGMEQCNTRFQCLGCATHSKILFYYL